MIINYDSIEKIKFKDYELNDNNNIEIINKVNEFAKICFSKNVYFILTGSIAMLLNFNKIYRDIKDIDIFFKYDNFDLIYDIIEILHDMGFDLYEESLSTITHKEKRYASNLIENISDNFDTATTYIIDGEKFYIKNSDLISPYFDNRGIFHNPNSKNSLGFNQIEKAGKFFRIWFKNTLLDPSRYKTNIYYKNSINEGKVKASFSYNEFTNVPYNDWWCSELLPIELLESKFEYKIELEKFIKNFSLKNDNIKFKFEFHIEDYDYYELEGNDIEDLFYNGFKFGVTTSAFNFITKTRYQRVKDADDLEFYSMYKGIR